MGITTVLSRTNVRLGFLIVRQEWLRSAAKLYLKYRLPLYSASTCRTRVQSIACFSDFLAEVKPQATAKDITRRLLLDYLTYLQKRVRTGMRQEQFSIWETSWRCRTARHGFPSDRND